MAKICLIEDEVGIRDMVEDELKYLGHKVVTAGDGQAGLKQILATKPDLIISDIHMPIMNGFEMRSRLAKDHAEYAKIPFVFLSAFADQADIADGMVVGVEA